MGRRFFGAARLVCTEYLGPAWEACDIRAVKRAVFEGHASDMAWRGMLSREDITFCGAVRLSDAS